MRNLFDPSTITIYQANTVVLEINMTDIATGEPVIPSNTDEVVFTVVDSYDKTVIQKRLTAEDYDRDNNVMVCTLTPEDTADLLTGDYRYDCLYVYDGTTPTTFISSAFVVKKSYGKIGGDSNG